ncbi:hypothetical protein ACA910_006172 [Epithemia clementina (nom. ined.)]
MMVRLDSAFYFLLIWTTGTKRLWCSALNFRLYGMDYTLRIGPDWASDAERCKTFEDAVADMTQLKAVTENIRTYSLNDCLSGDIMLRATQQVGGLGLWLGIWIGPNGTNFPEERAELVTLMATYSFDNVLGIHVSSGAIGRGDLTVEQAIQFRNDIKDDMTVFGLGNIPVTIADSIDKYMEYPDLVTMDDSVVHFNQFPFYDRTTNINEAATYVSDRVALLPNVGTRRIVIGESGWADEGINPDANPANAPSMRKWMRDFVCLAQARRWAYFWFMAYDSDWQRVQNNDPNGVDGHFGLFAQDGTMKSFFQDFSIDCSEPPTPIDPDAATFQPTTTPAAAPPTSLPLTLQPTHSLRPTTATPPSAPPSQSQQTAPPTQSQRPTLTTENPAVAQGTSIPSASMAPSWSPTTSSQSPSWGEISNRTGTFAPSIFTTTDVPSMVPSVLPSESQSPAGSPAAIIPSPSPTSGNSSSSAPSLSLSPTSSPFSDASSPPSNSPVTVPPSSSVEPTTTPSSTPSLSMEPTTGLSSVPSQEPDPTPAPSISMEPSNLMEPSWAPSLSMEPSSALSISMEPSSEPSAELSSNSTTLPTVAVPTSAPSSQPTEIPVVSTSTRNFATTVRNLQLTLIGVSIMNDGAIEQFKLITKNWYISIYKTKRSQRSLQVDTQFSYFDTEIEFQSQNVTDDGNTVTYNQVLFYSESADIPQSDPRNIVTSPFSNDILRAGYYDWLRTSDDTFANVTDDGDAPSLSIAQVVDNGGTSSNDSDKPNVAVIGALGGFAGLLVIGLGLLVMRRRGHEKSYHVPIDNQEPVYESDHHIYYPDDGEEEDDEEDGYEAEVPSSERSPLYSPAIVEIDTEQTSLCTEDFDLGQVLLGGTGRSVVTDVEGALIKSAPPVEPNPWARLGPEYRDPKHLYTVEAPPGKLGVIVDTPDSGPGVVFAVKETSVLVGKIQVGDRLLSVDDEDVTKLSPVHISRLITKKSNQPVRVFTLMRSPENR